MEYPRTVIVESQKLMELLKKKSDLILEGREISHQIEELEAEMKAADEAIVAIEKTIDVGDLTEQAKILTERMNVLMDEMDGLKKQHAERMKAGIAPEAIAVYEDAKKKKEELETERNKVALKAQKFNDKIIPMGRKCMAPLLKDEFEDFDTLRLEDGNVVGTIFSHMEDFKTNYMKNKKSCSIYK